MTEEDPSAPSTSGAGEPRRRATGVRLADGRVFRGKVVISNATRWVGVSGWCACVCARMHGCVCACVRACGWVMFMGRGAKPT